MGTGRRRQLVAGWMKSKELDYQTAGRAGRQAQLPDADWAQALRVCKREGRTGREYAPYALIDGDRHYTHYRLGVREADLSDTRARSW